MTTTTTKLRNCQATVTTNCNDWGVTSHVLTSYNTDVCMIGMLEGEVVNELTGEVINTDGDYYVILRADWYDYSMTTMQHVRKFIADLMEWDTTITELRKLAVEPNDTHVIVVDW